MKLVWLDLETSGLSARNDHVLEIAVARAELNQPFDITHVYHAVLLPVSMRMDPFVGEMHTKNGLLEECLDSGISYDVARAALLELLPQTKEPYVLAGSSVHFDHEFLRWHFEPLSRRFSHRHYDVSAVKLFAQSLGMPKLPKAEAHRAKADIEESVAHAKACAEWFRAWRG